MLIKDISPIFSAESENSNLSTELSKNFSGLFPTWTTMLATILSLTIILIVLSPLVFKATKKMVEKRRKYIQDNIDQAEQFNNNAHLDRREANQELIQARESAAKIISKAKIEAEEYKEANLSIAKDEASKIIASAKDDMRKVKEKFAVESKEAIVDVALAAAAKVVNKSVDNKTSKKIIDNFIKDK